MPVPPRHGGGAGQPAAARRRRNGDIPVLQRPDVKARKPSRPWRSPGTEDRRNVEPTACRGECTPGDDGAERGDVAVIVSTPCIRRHAAERAGQRWHAFSLTSIGCIPIACVTRHDSRDSFEATHGWVSDAASAKSLSRWCRGTRNGSEPGASMEAGQASHSRAVVPGGQVRDALSGCDPGVRDDPPDRPGDVRTGTSRHSFRACCSRGRHDALPFRANR